MSEFLQGGTMVAALGVAVFFLRYWQRTQDRLFLAFSLAFGALALSRALLSALAQDAEARTAVYLLRALAFLLIALAVVDKNLRREG